MNQLTACVELDLRIERNDQPRDIRFALDGIRPNDVVKLIVDRTSTPSGLYTVDLHGVRFQVTADSVHTRRTWEAIIERVTA